MSDLSGDDQPNMESTSTDNPSTPVRRNVKQFEYRRQTKRIVQNVYNFFLKLRLKPNFEKIDFTKTQNVTAEACGVSLRTVQRISLENKKNDGKFISPRKNISPKRPKTDLDSFNQDIVRRTIHEFYDQGEFPTTKKVHKKLQEKINYEGSVSSVLRIIHNKGFSYKKCNDGRKFLMERGDIVVKRLEFLRKINAIRDQTPDKPIFYLDETWINQNHTRAYIWHDSHGNGGLKVPTGKGARIIILHIGSAKTGFIPECKLMYRNTKTVSSDYHSEMNGDIFKEWFMNMLKLLDEPSVIVMDNASYHSMELNRAPSTNSKKEIIQNWLTEKNISFSPMETKIELLEKVKKNKKKEQIYELDEEAYKAGHEVVRLPPYHCQYNPIELVWAQIKNEVASKNHTFKIADVEKLTHEAIQNVTIENWKRCVEHAENIQKQDIEKEMVREIQMERIILTINPDDDDSDFGLSEDDDDENEF